MPNEGAIAPALPGYATDCNIHYYRTGIFDLAMVSTGTLENTNFLHIVGNLVKSVAKSNQAVGNWYCTGLYRASLRNLNYGSFLFVGW